MKAEKRGQKERMRQRELNLFSYGGDDGTIEQEEQCLCETERGEVVKERVIEDVYEGERGRVCVCEEERYKRDCSPCKSV